MTKHERRRQRVLNALARYVVSVIIAEAEGNEKLEMQIRSWFAYRIGEDRAPAQTGNNKASGI
jgi:hypothetical protein